MNASLVTVSVLIIAVSLSSCASHMVRGDRALEKGSFDKAILEYQKSIERESDTAGVARARIAEVEVKQGTLDYDAGRFEEAVAHMERAVQSDENNAWGWFFKGIIKTFDDDWYYAWDDLQIAAMKTWGADLDRMRSMLLGLADERYESQVFAESMKYMIVVRDLFLPLPDEYMLTLATSAYESENYDVAIDTYRLMETMEVEGEQVLEGLLAALTDRAMYEIDMGLYVEAEADVREILEGKPGDGLVQYLLGEALEGQRRFGEAIGAYKASESDLLHDGVLGALVRCYCGRGTESLTLGDFEKARADFEEALKIEPGNGRAHLGMAEYFLNTPITLSKKELRFLIEHNGKKKADEYRKSNKVQRYGRAIAEVVKAMDSDPDDLDAGVKFLDLVMMSGFKYVNFTEDNQSLVSVRNDTSMDIGLEVTTMNGKSCKRVPSSEQPSMSKGVLASLLPKVEGYIMPGETYTFRCKPGVVAIEGMRYEFDVMSVTTHSWSGADYMEAYLEYHWALVTDKTD